MSLAKHIIYGDKSSVQQLLQEGADVNEIDEYGFRPIIEAAIANKTDIAELLLDYGADVDERDATGRSALHWAAENNNLGLVKLLLDRKADPNAYTLASQPVLVQPILRTQNALKNLLYKEGADLNFAQDYINTKLLGHRFELIGQADIVDNKGRFIELDFEGFFLEFTLSIILNSLQRYKNNFAAKHLRHYFKYTKRLIDAFTVAAKLIKFQQYTVNIAEYAEQIDGLLDIEPLIIPVAHRGHAITFIKYGEFFAKCDRGANSEKEGSINIYRIHNRDISLRPLFKKMMYVRQSKQFMEKEFKQVLGLEHLWMLPLSAQITGNCSWANVESALPTMLFLLLAEDTGFKANRIRACIDHAMSFYQQWLQWDQDRALYDCIQGFYGAEESRKASKAAVLGAILFQHCQYTQQKDVERAEKILSILMLPKYRYVLDSYVDIYYRRNRTAAGVNLINLLDIHGVKI